MMATMDSFPDPPGFSSHQSEDTESNADSSMASSSVASIGRSRRYQVAMTARARQRRIRRMTEKEPPEGGEAAKQYHPKDQSASSKWQEEVNKARATAGKEQQQCIPAEDTTTTTASNTESHDRASSRGSSNDRRSRAVVAMKASRGRSSPVSNSHEHQKEVTADPTVPNIRSNRPADANHSSAMSSINSTPKRANSNSNAPSNHHSHRQQQQNQQQQHQHQQRGRNEQYLSNGPSQQYYPPHHQKPPPSPHSPYSPSSPPPLQDISYNEEFLPQNLQDGLLLTPQEVRDAANFTSIQFKYSTLSGEVEMFSDGEDQSTSHCPGTATTTTNSNNNNNNSNSNNNNAIHDNASWQNEVWSDATTPSILNRTEIFHHKAASSIVSLLSPERMVQAGLMAPEGQEEDVSPIDVNGDSPTGVTEAGGLCFEGDDDPGVSRGGEWKGTRMVERVGVGGGRALFHNGNGSVGGSSHGNGGTGAGASVGISHHANQSPSATTVYQSLKKKMIDPSQQLSDLLQQIHRPPTMEIDRAFATRRKNACGALKILSAKECNRLKICWTIGVLPAIASVLSDVDANLLSNDALTTGANTEARNRIVSTLLNLSVNKKNRMLICNTPGVLESISKVILGDDGESRQGCCTVLLYLSKTPETRPFIVECPGLLESLAKVVEVQKFIPMAVEQKKKKGYKNRYLKKFQAEAPDSPDDGTLDSVISEDDGSSSSGSSHSGSSDGDENDENEDSSHSTKSTARSIEKKLPNMEIQFKNPAVAVAVDSSQVVEVEYDSDPNRFLHGARLSTFACLLCLVKNKENAFDIARCEVMVETLIEVTNKHSSPSHARAISILAHLTRHPKNCHHLVFRHTSLLPTLQTATGSIDDEARKYALCALQNLSMDKSCRTPIAHTPKMIWALTERCKRVEKEEEALAAMAALQNLSDEPANLIQFTIVKDCIGTIIKLARREPGRKTDLIEFMAQNTMATLSHWFRKIATSGSERIHRKNGKPGAPQELYNAVRQPTVFNQWA